MHRKQVDTAIVAMSSLASAWMSPRRRVSASELAEMHGLPAPSVAKTLHALARAGLVNGSPGPGGGYVLARDPGAISLWDVLSTFVRGDVSAVIPFANLLGGDARSPTVRDRMRSARAALRALLMETSIADLHRTSGGGGTHRPGEPGSPARDRNGSTSPADQGRIPPRTPVRRGDDMSKETMP